MQPIKHADETGWTEAKRRAWLWVVVTANVAVFLIRRSRGAVVAKELLGEDFTGILVSDRWSGYNWIPTSMGADRLGSPDQVVCEAAIMHAV